MSTEPATSPLDRPITTVRFLVLEQLKGEERLFDLAVRGAGSSTCFADTYQRGGEYVMFLRLLEGALTPCWLPLAPTNKQVHGADDPWVARVRKELELGPVAFPPTRFRVKR